MQAYFTFCPYLSRILGQWDILLLNFTSIGFHEFYLDVSSLIVKTSAFEKKIKDETSKKEFVKPMEVNRACIGSMNLFGRLIFEFFLFSNADVVTIKDETTE